MNIDVNLKIFSLNWKVSVKKQWIQFSIVLAVILMSLIIPYWGSVRIFQLLLILLVGSAGILVLLRQPNLGFILIFFGALYYSYSMQNYERQYGGMNIVVAIIALLLFLWFLDMLVIKREFQFVKSRVTLPALVFLVISGLAFGMGQIRWYVSAEQAPLFAQLGGLIIFVFSVSFLLMFPHFVYELQWLKIIVWIFIAIGFLYVTKRLFDISFLNFNRGISGSMLYTWLVVLPFSQVIFNTRLRPIVRWVLVGFVLLTLYYSISRNYAWKSGWIPPLVSVAVILALRFKRIPRFVIPISLIFAVYIAGTLITSLIATDEYSWITRVEAWKIILDITRVNPLLGTGFSNYYWYTPLFPILGWRVHFNSHSQYVDLFAQTGILGLLCFFWIFFEVGRLSWNISRKLPDGFAKAYSYSVMAGLIATLLSGFLGDWVLPFVYNIGLNGFRASILPWIFFGGLISIEQMIQKNNLLQEL